jgi:phage terminase Nu1 subunit (DNA packaging protein)
VVEILAIQKTVAVATLAKFLGIKQRRIYQLVEENILIKDANYGGKFPLIENVNRYINYVSDKTYIETDENNVDLNILYKREKVRLTKAQADNEEIKARLASNQAIDAEELEFALADVLGLIRNKLLNLPERLETTLVGETDKDQFKKILTTELKDAMFEVCDGVDQTIHTLTKRD